MIGVARRPSPSTTFALLLSLCGGIAGCAAQKPEPAPAPTERQGAQDPLGPAAFEATLVRAREAEAQGDAAAAAEAYLALHRSKPGDPMLAVKAGESLGAAGRLNDAVSVLIRAQERFASIPDVDTLLARTFLLKAEENLRGGSGYDPNVLGYFEQALELCERVVERHPTARDAHLIRAQTLYQLSRWDEAEAAATDAAERFPSHPGPHNLLGQLWVQRCRNALLRLAEEGLDDDARAAAAAERDAAAASARRAFGDAIERDGERAFPHRMLGNLAAALGEIEPALGHFEAAIALDPMAGPDPQWLIANAGPERRASMFAAALERNADRRSETDRGVLLWHLAKARLDGGAFVAAREGFEQALEANSEDLTAHYYAFIAAWWGDQRDHAARHAAALAQSDPVAFADIVRAIPERQQNDVVDILRWMAARARENGEPKRCRDLNQVLAYTLKTAVDWNNYALLCWEGGEYERAYEGYLRALRVEPDSPQLLNDAGAVLQHHLPTPENLATARALYEKAIERAAVILEDDSISDDDKQRARTARDNARANLAELPPG